MRLAPAVQTDDEDVGVVPMTRPDERRGGGLPGTDFAHAAPRVMDVIRRAPALPADFSAPLPHLAHAVLAKAENDVAFLRRELFAHERVGFGELRRCIVGALIVSRPETLRVERQKQPR